MKVKYKKKGPGSKSKKKPISRAEAMKKHGENVMRANKKTDYSGKMQAPAQHTRRKSK